MAGNHDYRQYSRIQLRAACKYLRLSQNAPRVSVYHNHAKTWDSKHASNPFHNYIIRDRSVSNSFDEANNRMELEQWRDAYAPMIGDEETQEASEEQENMQKTNLDDVGEEETDIGQALEQIDLGEDVIGGTVEGEFTTSTERTINSTTYASAHSSKISYTPKSGEQTAGAAETDSPRRSKRNIKNASVSEQTVTTHDQATKTVSKSTSKQNFQMAESQRERRLLKLRLSQDPLRQEQLRIESNARSKVPKAEVDDATSTTEQVTIDDTPTVDAQDTGHMGGDMRIFGGPQTMGGFPTMGGMQMRSGRQTTGGAQTMGSTQMMGGTQIGGVGGPMSGSMGRGGPTMGATNQEPSAHARHLYETRNNRGPRLKSTPPAALAKREREDKKFDAAMQRRLKDEREEREVNQEEYRRRQEESIEMDKKAKRWALFIDQDANFQYQADLARDQRGGADPIPEVVEARRRLKQEGMLRGVNPFPGIKGSSKSPEAIEKEEREMREFLVVQATKGNTYFPA
ncbi:hypothetical protein G6011_11777 [Alternaria panax]|uniref:Uncharacterized protein n=1 Tax=Alternaria panax TaxID=48097 RepID=A0AAD4I4G3_9PLEO|nr:hypothetical protein G6011_11777 [Alternaria panax]